MKYNQKFEKIWIVEFITDDDDSHMASFLSQPTQDDVEAYIGENDWLLEEMEAGTLEWIIFPLNCIDNVKGN